MEGHHDDRTDVQCLDEFLVALRGLEEELESNDADGGLNVFEVLGITNTEIRHSNVIGWLMTPGGNHGLGSSVLAGLIERAGGEVPDDLGDFRIMRESDNIDILAASRASRMTLAIENKVWSGEHDDQLSRYHAIIERRYPGWTHLYLFLSPAGLPPEGERDREDWLPIDYRALLGIIGDAMEAAEMSDKARMIIDDYCESVRRHIMGNESLQSRCVDIYLEHKRAIDLIMNNLPDTAKTMHEFAREWAKRQDGIEVVDGCSRGKQYVRFRTERLKERFPEVDGSDNWGQRHYWFYEVETKTAKDGVGCALKFQLCFHLPAKSPLSAERAKDSRRFVEAFARGDRGMFTGTYTGFFYNVSTYAPGEFDYETIARACDGAWDAFLGREDAALEAVFG